MTKIIETLEARQFIVGRQNPYNRRLRRLTLGFGFSAAALLGCLLYFLGGEREPIIFIGYFCTPLVFALLIEISLRVPLPIREWEFDNEEVRLLGSQKAGRFSWDSVTSIVVKDVAELSNHVEVRLTNRKKNSFAIFVHTSDVGLPIFRSIAEKTGKVEQVVPPKSDRAGG